jgi:outer membrane protein OmpA-like peptidoglycan-associated protein
MRSARTTVHADASTSARPRIRSRTAPHPAGLSNQALQRHVHRGPRATFTVGARSDAAEHEASQAAASFLPGTRPRDQVTPAPATPTNAGSRTLASAMGETGTPLDRATRAGMERHFGVSFSDVRVHTGPRADQLARSLGARAFTYGRDIVFGEGRRPGADALTAHELAHVVQQTAGRAGAASQARLSPRSEPNLLQCSFAASVTVPSGVFEVDLQTVGDATAPPANRRGMDATLRFIPGQGAPNSNVIWFNQIVRIIDTGGADLNPVTMPPAQAPRGALGSSGVRTQADPLHGVEGGFFTDVWHQASPTSAPAAPGSALSPRYQFGPGLITQVPGFKRSDDSADIRSAAMEDRPGVPGTTANMDFSFESVALGEDTMVTYGEVNWGFGVRAGSVVNERHNVVAGQSATFNEALERHRDFYIHEPVTFYFDFNSAVLSPSEEAKIATFTAYLARNPDIHMEVEGFADITGGDTDYNRDLSLWRAEAVKAALIARGIPEETIFGPAPTTAHVGPITAGHGASTAATTNAGTGDQGGNPAVGADQTREANRWANRRVVLTFRRATAAAP